MPELELELVETDELLEELRKRYDACVFVGVQERTEDFGFYDYSRHGDYLKCLGLCSYATKKVLKNLDDREEEPPNDS